MNVYSLRVLECPYSCSNSEQQRRTCSSELNRRGTGVKSLPHRIIFLTRELERDHVRDVIITGRLPDQTRRNDNDSNKDPQQNQREDVAAQKRPPAPLSALLAIHHNEDDANQGGNQKTHHPG